MRRAAPSPPVVLIAGDLLAHEFRQTYEKVAPHPTRRRYREFVDKTIAYLAARFDAKFPRAQFVITLGNNDSYCGDYRATPGSPRLHVVSVDDIFWSAEYKNACGSPRSGPGAKQAQWLGAAMRKLPPGHRALIITHEPPGIDVFATLDGAGAPVHPSEQVVGRD